MRASGILLHISSLPSPYGIGTLGKAAYEFADFLQAAGQRYWQLLPLGPTSYGDSPYQSFSTFAGNPYFIDLDLLAQEKLLQEEEIQAIDWSCSEARTDYGFLFSVRYDLLYKAFLRGRDKYEREIQAFRGENPWLEDYALFMALKRSRQMASWDTWPEEIRLRHTGAAESYATVLAEDMNFFIFLQFMFYRQWDALRAYLHEKEIQVIGDIPIYVPYDSCDVWANPHLFQLDGEGKPTAVAGCPPDSFSAEGQLWGNPLYDWKKMEQDGFDWWKKRIAGAARLYDVIRIDHFRGLESYWAVPYGEQTAINGRWIKGPDHAFIDTLRYAFPHLRLIAEDLGFLTPEVIQLQKDSGYPGMKVLEFAFDPREPSNYLPHRYERNCICYSGTHDNETLMQWLEGQDEETLDYVAEYLGIDSKENLRWGILRAGMASVADTFIAQIQDYLGLSAEARMNEPGTLGKHNWSWRLAPGVLTQDLAKKIKKLTVLYER